MKLNPIDTVLLACLGSARVNPQHLAMISSHSEWKQAISRPVWQDVAPLLSKQLDQRPELRKAFPPLIIENLRLAYYETVARNLKLFNSLSDVLRLINQAGIPVIVLKGAFLAKQVYGDIGLRPMLDADLLFRKQDLGYAQKLLAKAQYSPYGTRLHVDYHWILDASWEKNGIVMDGIWQRAQPVEISGRPALALAPEDLILHLTLHTACHHLFGHAGLRSLYDLKVVAAHYQGRINWQMLGARAKKWKMANALCLTLHLAKTLLDADVPATAALSGTYVKQRHRIVQWAINQIFAESALSHISPYYAQLFSEIKLREKLRNLIRLVFPTPQVLSTKYAAPCGTVKNYATYLTRIGDYCLHYVQTSWKIMRKDEYLVEQVKDINRDLAMRSWLGNGDLNY
jgi:hypothetical protein